jgi:transposase
VFDARYRNDETGASAYHPGVLLKVVLLGYARGLTSSRSIERACRENIVFMALSGDWAPHFTTIAGFVAKLPDEITAVFRDVLLVCDEQGLIGKELFAVDGCKLPSNASRTWSGTRADLQKKAEKMEKAIGYLLDSHRRRACREFCVLSHTLPIRARKEVWQRKIRGRLRLSFWIHCWLDGIRRRS